MNGTEDRRRLARIPVRCGVAVREKMSSWIGETEDLGARGCRIALKRSVAPGSLLQLAFEAGPGVEPLVVLGQVAWVSRSAPLNAGIKFLAIPREASGARPGFWLDRIVAVALRRAAVRGPGAAAVLGPLADVRLRMCGTPSATPSAAEQAVVTLARGEGAISAAGFAAERLGTIAALLERGVVTVGLSGGPGQESRPTKPALTPPRPIPQAEAPRAAAAQAARRTTAPGVIAPPASLGR